MRTDIESRINEAEVCRSMGLYGDSLNIYESILSIVSPQDAQVQDKIKKRIGLLKKEIADQEDTKPKGVSAKDISMLKKSFSSQGDVSEILDSASAFQEMGLHGEAVAEYVKMFKEEYPADKIVPGLVESLMKLHSPSKAVKEIDKLIEGQKIARRELSLIKFAIGQEFEKRDHRDQAHDLYSAAASLDIKNAEIKKRLDSVSATFASGSKYDYLLRENMVTTDKLQQAFALSKKMKKSVEYVLIEHFHIKKEAIGKSFSLFYGCPFRPFDSSIPVPVELLSNLKKTFLLNELWIPLSWDKEGVEILVDDPRNLNKTDNIKTLMKTGKITFSVAIREDIQEFIRLFFDQNKQMAGEAAMDDVLDDFDMLPDVEFEEEVDDVITDEVDEASSQVVKLVDQAIIAAYRKNASDIHIEPSPITKATSIRFRMDGVCQEYTKVPNSMVRGIVSRVKIMSNLDIAERRLPQDGKIKFRRKGVPAFELRVATLPTAGGFEDVVMRILASAGAMAMDEMGLTQRNLKVMKQIIAKPYGLILAVGPTGSGKTTSLHAILGHINKPGIKIWTAEDPIEITQAGLRQTEVKPKIGLDFARMMRAFLRADPDVIMIGEMRDEETASIGIEASLTGHLVFSTLHTNDSASAITRLVDLGVEPFLISSSVNAVLAQRLVRVLCPECKQPYRPDDAALRQIGIDPQGTQQQVFYRAGGCDHCFQTGYRGRTGIFEIMELNEEMKSLILKTFDSNLIKKTARQNDMISLRQDGIRKLTEGVTTIEEVFRVTQL